MKGLVGFASLILATLASCGAKEKSPMTDRPDSSPPGGISAAAGTSGSGSGAVGGGGPNQGGTGQGGGGKQKEERERRRR